MKIRTAVIAIATVLLACIAASIYVRVNADKYHVEVPMVPKGLEVQPVWKCQEEDIVPVLLMEDSYGYPAGTALCVHADSIWTFPSTSVTPDTTPAPPTTPTTVI